MRRLVPAAAPPPALAVARPLKAAEHRLNIKLLSRPQLRRRGREILARPLNAPLQSSPEQLPEIPVVATPPKAARRHTVVVRPLRPLTPGMAPRVRQVQEVVRQEAVPLPLKLQTKCLGPAPSRLRLRVPLRHATRHTIALPASPLALRQQQARPRPSRLKAERPPTARLVASEHRRPPAWQDTARPAEQPLGHARRP